MNLQVWKAERTPTEKNGKITTLRHSIIKLSKFKTEREF